MEQRKEGIAPSFPRTLRPGDRAPNFTLPAINSEGVVSLEDYRRRSSVLVGLLRGLY
jgi:hypothetical protein